MHKSFFGPVSLCQNFKHSLSVDPDLTWFDLPWFCAQYGPLAPNKNLYKMHIFLATSRPLSLCTIQKKALESILDLWQCVIFGPKIVQTRIFLEKKKILLSWFFLITENFQKILREYLQLWGGIIFMTKCFGKSSSIFLIYWLFLSFIIEKTWKKNIRTDQITRKWKTCTIGQRCSDAERNLRKNFLEEATLI